jgi:hypothetical protein
MKPLGWKNQIASPDCAIGRNSGVLGQNKSFLHYVGWMSGQKNLRLPVAGEVLFLTFPFIELHRTWPRYRWIRFFALADDDVDSGLRTIKCFGCAGETLLSRDRKKYAKLGVATASTLVAI